MKAKGPLILVIDDELQIRRMLRLSLEAHGYAVIDAVRADEGLRLVADAHPDLVILDLELPDKNGLQTLTDLRAWSETPVIVLSIHEAEKDKIDLLDAGADDYITKPFGMGELLARIRGVLRRRTETPGEGVFRTGGIGIDFGRRLVFRGDEEIKLTPTEYSLLRHLARHAGKIVTRDQLLKELWGPDVEPDESYLRVYVLQLRRKLEKDPARPKIILTEPGVGYRLAEASAPSQIIQPPQEEEKEKTDEGDDGINGRP
ncbi:MAG: response regulator transcription factor [Spirochaetales bacterium]|nr:response regulator transcription factor [Spirochaetales bacterium]